MLSRFHLIPACDYRQTDGPTDRQNCYINIARQCADALTRDKNYTSERGSGHRGPPQDSLKKGQKESLITVLEVE